MFKNYVNNCIENGNHSFYGDNKYDFKEDYRYSGNITAKCMRIYLSDFYKSGCSYVNICKRKYK